MTTYTANFTDGAFELNSSKAYTHAWHVSSSAYEGRGPIGFATSEANARKAAATRARTFFPGNNTVEVVAAEVDE